MKIFKIVLAFIVSLYVFSGASFAQTKLAAGVSGDAAKQVAVASAPANCSAFLGVWVGRWSYGDYGEMRLEVLEVGASCVARGSYGKNNGKLWPYDGVEIKGDVLSWLCSTNRNGTCSFENHGNTLWANYTDTNGGRNTGVFRKAN